MELSAEYLREKLRQDLEAEHVVSPMPGGRGRWGRTPGACSIVRVFCRLGGGGHDSEPLRDQLPSPGGVG